MTHQCCTACELRFSRSVATKSCPTCAQPLTPLAPSAALGYRLFADDTAASEWTATLADALALPPTPPRP
jgi:hypothetical protein